MAGKLTSADSSLLHILRNITSISIKNCLGIIRSRSITNSISVMTTISNHQLIMLTLAPMMSGLVSFVASSTIIIMILRSTTKLTKAYRRIIFGMCIYDVLLSVCHLMSVFPCPRGTRLGSIGNLRTCEVQGFFVQVRGNIMMSSLHCWNWCNCVRYRHFSWS